MIRLKVPLFAAEKASVNTPHSCGCMLMFVDTAGVRFDRLCFVLKVIAPLRAGLEGWSVAATVLADARAQITDGRAAPRQHWC
jgi:hypothetical protein